MQPGIPARTGQTDLLRYRRTRVEVRAYHGVIQVPEGMPYGIHRPSRPERYTSSRNPEKDLITEATESTEFFLFVFSSPLC